MTLSPMLAWWAAAPLRQTTPEPASPSMTYVLSRAPLVQGRHPQRGGRDPASRRRHTPLIGFFDEITQTLRHQYAGSGTCQRLRPVPLVPRPLPHRVPRSAERHVRC